MTPYLALVIATFVGFAATLAGGSMWSNWK
jgi:hypothetical protein